jgi:hypothetical protein
MDEDATETELNVKDGSRALGEFEGCVPPTPNCPLLLEPQTQSLLPLSIAAELDPAAEILDQVFTPIFVGEDRSVLAPFPS